MQERERQRDRLEAAAAAADRSVEIAQSYVVPAFVRARRLGARERVREAAVAACAFLAVVVLGSV